MGDVLRFVLLPAAIILSTIWVIALQHRRSMIVPYLLSMVALLVVLRLLGLSPLGFFVSLGGYVWFAVLAWIGATMARSIDVVIHKFRQ